MLPRANIAWFVAAVLGPGRPYVLCRDDDLAPPAQPGVLEVRGVCLWSHAICETPLEHWTVAMEAFAVSMDDPYEAWHGERGDRIGLAFDLEWESEADAPQWSEPGVRYDVACRVNGDLQVGEESWTISVHGSRAHHWGEIAPTSVDRSDVSSGAAPFLLPGPTGARRLLRRLWSDGG